jgi:cytochrome c oxidase subunit 2
MTPAVGTRLVSAGALVALLANAAPALAGNGGFAPVPPESPPAEDITWIWRFISIFIVAIFLLVEVALVVLIVRYRRARRARYADGAQIHGATSLEIAWTLLPILILVGIATVVFVELPGIRNVAEAGSGGRGLQVEVSGRQFYWQYTYPNGAIAIDRMRAPVDTPVEVAITAPDWDVIHSWWVPALQGKFDAIPGQTNRTWFQTSRTGTFEGRCGELCGLQHAAMETSVEVLSQTEYEAWVAERVEQLQSRDPELGQEIYDGACAKCHGLEGEGGVADDAPRLSESAIAEDPEALERVVRNGGQRMPPVGRDWSQDQMATLTAYVSQRIASGR